MVAKILTLVMKRKIRWTRRRLSHNQKGAKVQYAICNIKVRKMLFFLRAKQGLNFFVGWGSAGGLCY